jgi:hypothetical protein
VLVVIDDKQFFDPVFLQHGFRLIQRGTDWNRDQRLFRHHFRDGNVEPCFKTKIAIGNDADEVSGFINNRNAADVKSLHHL